MRRPPVEWTDTEGKFVTEASFDVKTFPAHIQTLLMVMSLKMAELAQELVAPEAELSELERLLASHTALDAAVRATIVIHNSNLVEDEGATRSSPRKGGGPPKRAGR